MKIASRLLTTLLLFLSVSLAAPNARAVVPPPDGGYPGFNTAEGQNALFSVTTGQANTAVGWLSLRSTVVGGFNTAVGAGTLLSNLSAQNTAAGAGALLANTSGTANTAGGALALFSNTGGNYNTALGANALLNSVDGNNNTAIGISAIYSLSTGDANTAVGEGALFNCTTCNNNTAVGDASLFKATSSHNTAIGSAAGSLITTAHNVICIGSDGANVSNSCFIGNIRDVTTQNGDAIPVVIDSAGQLGTVSSSQRFKERIKPMAQASESLLALKPVMFQYKNDKTDTPQFGLVAEEVAAVDPDLVVCDAKGEIYSVRYDAVNAMLLNEFLKEYRKGKQQDRKIEELEATVAKLADQLQKVNARVQTNNSSTQIAVIDR